MSFVRCPDCGKEIRIFGESHIEKVAEEFGYPLLAKMPIDPALTELVDEGHIEWIEKNPLAEAAEAVTKTLA
jgi:hypothetical protein